MNAVISTNNETSEEHSQPLQADDDDNLHEVINVESSLIEEGKQMHGYSEIEGRLKAGLHEIEQKLFWELGKLRSEFAINNDPSFPTRQNLITEAERLRKANDVLQQRLRCVETEFKNLKEETRVLSEEKRSLVTALRLISNDSEETQPSRSSSVTTGQTKNGNHLVNEPSDDVSKAKIKIPKKKKKNKTKGGNPEHSDENKTHVNLEKKTVVILGDSIVKNVQGWKLPNNSSSKSLVKAFPGAKVDDICSIT